MENKLKSKKLWDFYLTNHTQINSTNLLEFGHIFADAIIGHGIHRLVQLVSKFQTVYYYRMDYKGKRSIKTDDKGNPRGKSYDMYKKLNFMIQNYFKGVAHADDLQYVMPSLWYGSQLPTNDSDIFMVKRLTQLWTSFAIKGELN